MIGFFAVLASGWGRAGIIFSYPMRWRRRGIRTVGGERSKAIAAAKAAAAKRWMRDLSNIEAVWQHDHGADYWRLAQEDDAREFHMLREYSAGRL